MSRGAQPAVLRAMGLTADTLSVSRAVSHEEARCPSCKSPLTFGLGAYGQTLERCTNARCDKRAPHHPEPEPDAERRVVRRPQRNRRRPS